MRINLRRRREAAKLRQNSSSNFKKKKKKKFRNQISRVMLFETVAIKPVAVEHLMWVVYIEMFFKYEIHTDFKYLVQRDNVKYLIES